MPERVHDRRTASSLKFFLLGCLVTLFGGGLAGLALSSEFGPDLDEPPLASTPVECEAITQHIVEGARRHAHLLSRMASTSLGLGSPEFQSITKNALAGSPLSIDHLKHAALHKVDPSEGAALSQWLAEFSWVSVDMEDSHFCLVRELPGVGTVHPWSVFLTVKFHRSVSSDRPNIDERIAGQRGTWAVAQGWLIEISH